MIIGIGIDIVELERIEQLLDRQNSFLQRILTPAEQEQFHLLNKSRGIEYVAGRFAVKEAIAKALGTGIGREFSWQDVAILQSHSGAPIVQWVIPRPNIKTHISISHSKRYACAQVLIEEKN